MKNNKITSRGDEIKYFHNAYLKPYLFTIVIFILVIGIAFSSLAFSNTRKLTEQLTSQSTPLSENNEAQTATDTAQATTQESLPADSKTTPPSSVSTPQSNNSSNTTEIPYNKITGYLSPANLDIIYNPDAPHLVDIYTTNSIKSISYSAYDSTKILITNEPGNSEMFRMFYVSYKNPAVLEPFSSVIYVTITDYRDDSITLPLTINWQKTPEPPKPEFIRP